MDLPRVKARAALKQLGLPASFEVGVLGSMVKTLRTRIELKFSIQISSGSLTITHLIAFYEEDAEDVSEYSGIQHVKPSIPDFPAFWESATAFVGYGFGLYEHYKNETRCWDENRDFPDRYIIAAHYTRSALTMSLPVLYSGFQLYEPPHRRVENTVLGPTP